MGGDHAPRVVLEAAPGLRDVVLVGQQEALALPPGVVLPVLHAPEVVGMQDGATAPLRAKPRSSIRLALEEVAAGRASAMVSCGHSGAVMAAALYTLGTLPGVDRAALVTALPRADGGRLVVLDLGANVDCKPELLATFAQMGAAYASVGFGVAEPRVGLLSNGEERGKGNQQVRAALSLLEALPLRFVGPVEPTDALRGSVDVLVCDGFVGNILLKTIEATLDATAALVRAELPGHPLEQLGAWLFRPALRRFGQKASPSALGGALLLGVRGVVVIGHGRSDARAVAAAVGVARRCVEGDLVGRIADALAPRS